MELHDCFSANELITYEALGLCEVGKAGEFIDKGENTYGGRVVVNVNINFKSIAFWWFDFKGSSFRSNWISIMCRIMLVIERYG